MSEYQRLLSFDHDNTEFARGVEVGLTWARLSLGRPTSVLMHADNAEMAIRLAEAHSSRATSVEISGDWLEVTFGEGDEYR